MTIFFAVEDELSRAVTERLICDCLGSEMNWRELGRRYGGSGFIRTNLLKYINLSRREKVLVVTDLDRGKCPPELRAAWLAEHNLVDPLPNNFVFCIAVREVEAWLLADPERIATFLGIHVSRIDRYVESNVADPKEYLLNLAKRGTRRGLRSELLPQPGSDARVGIGYNARLGFFAREVWDPVCAANNSASLRRAIARITSLAC